MTKKIGEMQGSQPIEVFKPHWFILVRPIFFTLISCACIFFFYFMYRKFLYDQIPMRPGTIFFISGFFFILSLGPIFSAIFYRETTNFGLYSDRLTFRSGFISRSVTTIPFSEMTSINLTQGVLGRILDFGTVLVESRGSDRLVAVDTSRAGHMVELAISARGSYPMTDQDKMKVRSYQLHREFDCNCHDQMKHNEKGTV